MIIDAAATDTGMRRSNNQDSYTVVRAPNAEAWRQRGHVFMVADGMGAHAVGELASKMACDLIPHNYMKTRVGHAVRGDRQGVPRGQRPDPQPGDGQSRLPGDGDDLLGAAAPPRRGADRARGRLAGLPHPGPPDRPALVRPQPGLGAGAAQPPHPRAGQDLGPQERDHPQPGAGGRDRGRRRGPAGRRARATSSCSAPTGSPARSRTTSSAPSPATSTRATPAATWSTWPTCAAAWTTSRS